jgi:hypothetical protein
MRTSILCFIILLLVICAISLNNTEGFAELCISPPLITTSGALLIVLIVTIVVAIASFYAWNWDPLRTTTSSHIIKRFFEFPKIRS